jgi:hypothetical protein
MMYVPGSFTNKIGRACTDRPLVDIIHQRLTQKSCRLSASLRTSTFRQRVAEVFILSHVLDQGWKSVHAHIHKRENVPNHGNGERITHARMHKGGIMPGLTR